MEPIRILHTYEPPYGWWFTSPDLPGLSGGAETYAAAHERAESAGRFTIECDAEDRGAPVPDLSAVEFVHFVPDTVVSPIAA